MFNKELKRKLSDLEQRNKSFRDVIRRYLVITNQVGPLTIHDYLTCEVNYNAMFHGVVDKLEKEAAEQIKRSEIEAVVRQVIKDNQRDVAMPSEETFNV